MNNVSTIHKQRRVALNYAGPPSKHDINTTEYNWNYFETAAKYKVHLMFAYKQQLEFHLSRRKSNRILDLALSDT